MELRIDGGQFSLEELKRFMGGRVRVAISAKAMARVRKSRAFVEKKLKSREPIYGINTGFGILADRRIPRAELKKLQENLVISHAVGVGRPLSVPLSRLIMLLRANALAMGYSGVRAQTLSFLVWMINRGITPIIPEQGSVGASGDLAPLAHIALAMTGRGDVVFRGKVMSAGRALCALRRKPLTLEAKEGLALINGTQVMTAMGVAALVRLENILKAADIVGALSIEGDRASRRPFDERLARLRPHPGQISTAANMRRLIAGSRIIASHARCRRVQDPYSFRCIPQVHGAAKDSIAHAREVMIRETGSCTDNPVIFADDDEIIPGGNFHGEPLAIALDLISIAAAEIGSISERRVAILIAPLSGELAQRSLVPRAGLNSGFMPAHVTMSALVSENKSLAHPASVDSIPTFGGQEDHVSMGPIAGRKALEIIGNVETILAVELLAACQAIDLQRGHGRPGRGTRAAFDLVRGRVKYASRDREYRLDIARCIELVRSGAIVEAAEAACGRLVV